MVGSRDEHASAESISDVDVGAVEVWVGHTDRVDATQLGDPVSRGVIEKRYAVPENVAVRRAHEQRPLTDPECWLEANADQVRFLGAQLGGAIVGQVRGGGPLLAVPADGLAFVLADRAVSGRRVGVGVLHGACRAYPSRHHNIMPISVADALTIATVNTAASPS